MNTKPTNDNYFKNFDAMDCPWVESPFFNKLLENSDLTKEEKELTIQFNEEGYVVVDLDLSDDFLNNMINKIDDKIKEGGIKTQEDGYHYSEHLRLFEAWKWNQSVLDIVKNKKILDILNLLYRRKPLPFQTINFVGGAEQPLHSDTIHFSSIPQRWLGVSWVALEDMDEENGTLMYEPKSHKLPIYEFPDINVEVPKYGEQYEAYGEYEEFLRQLVVSKKLEVKTFTAKKGQALIWSANLLHGSIPIVNTGRSRYSQATHYYFEGCDKYYSPMFSNSKLGIFSEKDMSTRDILNYKIVLINSDFDMKYKINRELLHRKKFGFFQSEKETFSDIAESTEMVNSYV